MNDSDGGFARHTLTIKPWTAFLAHGSYGRILTYMTVFAIVDAVFEVWKGKGTLSSAWRFDVADETLYPGRSLTTQYHESDLAFIARLLLEEGYSTFLNIPAMRTAPRSAVTRWLSRTTMARLFRMRKRQSISRSRVPS